jgi:hypothetical protein
VNEIRFQGPRLGEQIIQVFPRLVGLLGIFTIVIQDWLLTRQVQSDTGRRDRGKRIALLPCDIYLAAV